MIARFSDRHATADGRGSWLVSAKGRGQLGAASRTTGFFAVAARHGKMGHVLRWTTAGESHGRALVAVVEGMVAGVTVTSDDIADQLARRRLGYGRGARMKFERDQVTVLAGVRHGVTLGGPIAIEIGNTEWPKWETVMAADPVDAAELDVARNAPLTRPRPGHADYAGMLKYGFDDARPVLERASARETAARVAAGTVARLFLRQALGVEVLSHVVSIGESQPYDGPPPQAGDLAAIDASPVRAFDKAAEESMIAEIEAAKKDGDTLGGVVEAVAVGLPVGLGLVHQRRQPAGQPTSRRGDGHPGDQGRRDRRRVHHRASTRQPRPRRDVPRARRRRPLDQPGRRPGRRHDQRPTAAGTRCDEADFDRAARAGHRGHGDRR